MSDLKRNLRKYCENQYIDKLTTDAADMLERQEREIEKLTARCYPSKVIMIGDTGHYVSEAVAECIEELETLVSALEEVRAKEYTHKQQRIEDLEAQVAALEAENKDLLFSCNDTGALLDGCQSSAKKLQERNES